MIRPHSLSGGDGKFSPRLVKFFVSRGSRGTWKVGVLSGHGLSVHVPPTPPASVILRGGAATYNPMSHNHLHSQKLADDAAGTWVAHTFRMIGPKRPDQPDWVERYPHAKEAR